MFTYHGRWRLRVIGNDAAYPQRVVLGGSVARVIPGEIGQDEVLGGSEWTLRMEHHDGSRWKRSVRVSRQHTTGDGNRPRHVIFGKDTFDFDTDPNDLVLCLDEIATEPFAAEGLPVPSEDLLGVRIRNTGFEAFGYDAVVDISSAGRARLAEYGVLVHDEWPPAVLRSTGQEILDGAVSVPPLEVGEAAAVYFPVDATRAKQGFPAVEFELRRESDGRVLTSRCTATITVHEAPAHRPDPAPTPALPPLTSQVHGYRGETASE
ncbi:hypothetical protein [Amycolatopsis minnesotensis]|uniref:Uncharacterized protein n=1 Tax=Amycolatopsis minnesotensis TaxID=337894 RepID=A0ABN2RMZ1_9PSEU